MSTAGWALVASASTGAASAVMVICTLRNRRVLRYLTARYGGSGRG